MKLRTMVSAVTAAVLAVSVPVAVASPAQAGPSAVAGSYQTVSPVRVLDTRYGIGAPKASIAPLSSVTFTIPDEISTDIGSVLLEVTVVNPTAPGYATVFSPSGPRPVVSNINFQPGQNVPNTAIVTLTDNYEVTIYNGSKGTVDLLADVQGYFEAGQNQGDAGTLVPVTPTRYLDTRIGLGAAKGKVAPYSVTKLQLTGGVVPAGASAVAVNLTAVESGGQGFLTAYAGTTRPQVSTVNFYAGENRANLALLGLDADGSVSLYNGSPYSVDLLADVSGYFVAYPTTLPQTVAAGAYVPGPVGRVVDTRKANAGTGYVPALATLKVQIFEPADPIIAQIKAVAVNVTAVDPQASGFLTTWDGTTTVPAVSNVNFQAQRNSAGSIVVPLNPDGSIAIYNGSFGNVDMLVDLTGTFTAVVLNPTKLQASVRSAVGSGHRLTVIRHR